MLNIKPNCERCDKDLPAASLEAQICSYECTFCTNCVTEFLHNVCPNCGGGLVPRPIRPSQEYRSGVSLQHQPAQTERVLSKYSDQELQQFCTQFQHIKPESR